MSSRLRLPALAALAVAALPVLSACNTSPGAAALVGSQRITTGQLQSQVDTSIAGGNLSSQAGFDRTKLTRGVLAHLISVDVIDALAADHNVTITPAEIATETDSFVKQAGSLKALQQQAASNGVAPSQLEGFIRLDALQQKISAALVADLKATPAQLQAEYQKDIDQYDKIDIAQIAVKSPTLAKQILKQVRKNPASFATLAHQHSIDKASAAKGGEVGQVPTSQVQKLLGSTPVRVGTFSLVTSGGTSVVIHIISRSVTPIADVTSQLNAAIFATQATTVLAKAISAESAKLGVHVSPRYGKWDSATQTVSAVSDPISSSSATPTDSSATG